MLSPEHVRTQRRGDRLKILLLSGETRAEALRLSEWLLSETRRLVGHSREEVQEAWRGIVAQPKHKRLFDGLCKLVEDACCFQSEPPVDPRVLRKEVFEAASLARQSLAAGESLVREGVLEQVGARHGLTSEGVESALYADLRGAERLEEVAPLSAEELVERYDSGQLQAVLLRAVRVELEVQSRRPEGIRRLFQKLKFRRLLYRVERRGSGTYRIEIDGPFSMFESTTKYGLQLALLVPALEECDDVTLTAQLRWGKQRAPLRLECKFGGGGWGDDEAPLRDEVAALLSRLEKTKSPWKARPCADILDLPGVGLCVPDLVFERAGREPVYFEVMGFWSRDAVWKRVELVEEGLSERVLFAVSSRLRVSEEVLDEDATGALYVFKGTMSPKAVLARVAALSEGSDARSAPPQ